MSFKKKIIRIFLLALWIIMGAGVLVLLISASNIKSNRTCKGIDIQISGVKEHVFLDRHDILRFIIREEGSPTGKTLAGFNLRHLETSLKKNIWVKDAELFFDNNLLLHVNIREREPVARIFTKSGSSFYIDSSGYKMPVSDKMAVKLPVFTNFPAVKAVAGNNDSLLLRHIQRIAGYIKKNEFWMAQVAQVDILPNENFELVPTIGNHIIQFGSGEQVETKFKSLLIFYQQVFRRVGFHAYNRLNVQFANQLIATRRGSVTVIDSVRAVKNIEKMITEARTMAEDSTDVIVEKTFTAVKKDSTTHNKIIKRNLSKNNTSVKHMNNRINNPVVKKAEKPSSTGSDVKPKAVMKKIN